MRQTVLEPTPDPLTFELEAARAEIAGLKRSVESYQGILTRMEVGTVFHAPDTTIQYSNTEASEILGLSAEQMAGKAAIDPAWQFVTEEGSPLTVDEYPVNRVLSSLEPFGACVLGVDRPVAGDRVWVQVCAIPEFGLQRELRRVVVTFSNITERKRAEDALRRSEEKCRGLFRDAAIQSELDQGTTFAIYLPRHATEGTVVAPSEAPEASVARSHETILVVEDEPAVLKMIKRMLERLGYTVLTASTPGEAIQLACTHTSSIQLLLTDVIMPAMNGYDLATKLLAFYPSLKRLFMSGYMADVIAHHGVLKEGVHFIGKPFSKQDLEAKVSEALERG